MLLNSLHNNGGMYLNQQKIRLIDANALYDRYKHLSLQNGSCLGRHSGIAEEFLDAILKAPTIDPDSIRPVGKWTSNYKSHCSYCMKFNINRRMGFKRNLFMLWTRVNVWIRCRKMGLLASRILSTLRR